MKKLFSSFIISCCFVLFNQPNAASEDVLHQAFNCVFEVNGSIACEHNPSEAAEGAALPCVLFRTLSASPSTLMGPTLIAELRKYKNLPVNESDITVTLYGIESTPGESIHSGWRVATEEEKAAFWLAVSDVLPEEDDDVKRLPFSIGRMGGWILKVSYDETDAEPAPSASTAEEVDPAARAEEQ